MLWRVQWNYIPCLTASRHVLSETGWQMRVAVYYTAPLRRGATANEREPWTSMRKPPNEAFLLYWNGQRVTLRGNTLVTLNCVCVFCYRHGAVPTVGATPSRSGWIYTTSVAHGTSASQPAHGAATRRARHWRYGVHTVRAWLRWGGRQDLGWVYFEWGWLTWIWVSVPRVRGLV